MPDRKLPTWLRIILNLCGPAGLGVTLMGWVKPFFGLCIMAVGIVYVIWEIAPWITKQLKARPIVSLLVFMAIGASVGAGSWWMWKGTTVRSAELLPPRVYWEHPGYTTVGTPLSSIQLNAVSPMPGVFTYNPPAGTVLSKGENELTATFYPTDSDKYMSSTMTSTITVISGPPPTILRPVTAQLSQQTTKPSENQTCAPGSICNQNSPNSGSQTVVNNAPPLGTIRATQQSSNSVVVSAVGGRVEPVSFALIFDTEVTLISSGVGTCMMCGDGNINDAQGKANKKTIWLFWQSPALLPDNPITVTFKSVSPAKLIEVNLVKMPKF